MSSTRQILRVFLASPSDLADERRAIRDVLSEYNDSLADALGYHVELLGWEDTVAGFGRPQQIINHEVDRCDLFIGMMWKRWGTPPDNTGKYTSGFHEEFNRSVTRRSETGSPEISLFFKAISPDLHADPGEDLKKVLQFRDKIIAEKSLLFQNFKTIQDMERLTRKCITRFVIQTRQKDELSRPDEVEARALSQNSGQVAEDKAPKMPSLPDEGFEFLKNTIGNIARTGTTDQLSSLDVARFRLLANTISKSGNHEMEVGAHDINILFSEWIAGLELSEREIRCLVTLGFKHLNNENVPLWCWYSRAGAADLDPAFLSSVFNSSDNEKIGAISVLTSLSRNLPVDHEYVNREWIHDSWFSEQSSSAVRLAALEYFAKHGDKRDYSIVRTEYNRNDHATHVQALESMVQIRLRTDEGNQAQELILNTRFESLDTHTLEAALRRFGDLSTAELRTGLDHRNSQVRLQVFRILVRRGALSSENIRRMFDDRHAFIRMEAVTALTTMDTPPTAEEVKDILVRRGEKKIIGSGLLGTIWSNGSDKEGEDLFELYLLEKLRTCSNAELTKKVEASLVYEDREYLVRAEVFFSKHGDRLRRDIDSAFGPYFEEQIRRTASSFGHEERGQDIIRKARGLEDYIRKELTRKALDVLCRKGSLDDIDRIRTNLRTGYTGTSIEDVTFMAKFGQFDDVGLLANVEPPYFGTALSSHASLGKFQHEVGRALLRMARHVPVAKLYSVTMPEAMLKRTIALCPASRFSQISDDALTELLKHDSADVRKAASILAVRTFPKTRTKKILKAYISSNRFRYYNVFHWLDLGVSMSRKDARMVAQL